jgi:beta-phosphoglucomutase-like phosphatase (HAD superfamily)
MPIRAMIFDLDGTLVKTEELKALSYAKAAVELCPYTISEAAGHMGTSIGR